MQIDEILIIKNGSQSFGISTEDINQIFRVPEIMPLPFRPDAVRGLSAVSGITNVLDINKLLGMQEVDISDDKSRLLTLTGKKSSNSLLVSEVYNTVDIDSSKIEYINRDDNSVSAIYKFKDTIVQILSLDSLIANVQPLDIKTKNVVDGKAQADHKVEEVFKRFLIFKMQNERFAFEIDFLREIILADVQITEISGSRNEVLGLITLRDELITVIDLRTFYGFEKQDSDKNRILIVMVKNTVLGLLVDEIVDIQNFLIEKIEYFKDDFDRTQISGVLHDENLVSFLDNRVLESILEKNEAYIDSTNTKKEKDVSLLDTTELILFKLDSNEYAFEVDNVAEIIDFEKVTNVALTNNLIEGVINIRGQIVIIVSLYNLLKINENLDKDSKIMVCNINGNKVGFVVDSVSDILTIDNKDIQHQDDDEYITDILHLDDGKRLVPKIDIKTMITSRDFSCGKKNIDC